MLCNSFTSNSSMDKNLLKFIPKLLLFGSPFLLLAASYFVFDPFHVLKSYDHYGSNYLKTFNRNRLSTETFNIYYPEYKFNSFIFGSSRASAYHTEDWAKHIGEPSPFHFDAFNDNISGIRGKIEYIHKNGGELKNALIIIDSDTFSDEYDESESIVHHKDYRWTPESWLSYHTRFFKAYFKKKYFVSYLDLKTFKTYRPAYMDEFFKFKYYYTTPLNDFLFPENIEQIEQDSVGYYSDPEFHKRIENPKMLDRQIRKKDLNDLKIIDSLFSIHKTNFKVIIGPAFDQREYSPLDIDILNIYFGKENVYNFTGKNKYTDDITNYYEMSHYKPVVGKRIMEEIYSDSSKVQP